MKRRPGLRRTLLLGLLTAILLAWLGGVMLVFQQARDEVSEVFDAHLARSARVLDSLLLHEVGEDMEVADDIRAAYQQVSPEDRQRYPLLAALAGRFHSGKQEEVLDFSKAAGLLHRYESGLALVARYRDDGVMLRTPGAPLFPIHHPGFFDYSDGSGDWRGFGLLDPDSGFLVQVAEQQRIRANLVNAIATHSLAPFLLILPLLAWIIWISVGRALRPLFQLTSEVELRAPGSLAPLPDQHTPVEVLPLVNALNGLLRRVAAALENEHRFTADAAHELRTPLAAIKAHAQLARDQAMDPDLISTLNQVLVGTDRGTHLVAQLLAQARADAASGDTRKHAIDLTECARTVLAALAAQAVERHIDLSLEAASGIAIRGNRIGLDLLLRNLIDNALRYTNNCGRVVVRIIPQPDSLLLEVADNGPGVPDNEQPFLFERFFRGSSALAEGSGLGLSIVKCIAEQHHARLSLGSGLDGQGLTVRCRFPLPASVEPVG